MQPAAAAAAALAAVAHQQLAVGRRQLAAVVDELLVYRFAVIGLIAHMICRLHCTYYIILLPYATAQPLQRVGGQYHGAGVCVLVVTGGRWLG